MSDLQTRSIRAAILSTGTNQELSRDVFDATVPPTAQGTGYDVGDSLYGTLRVHMRRGGPRMVVDVVIDTEDLTPAVTYAITPDGGTTQTYTVPGSPPADTSALCEAIAAVWDGATELGAEAIERTSSGRVTGGTDYNAIRLTWALPEYTSLVVDISGTTARASVLMDPQSARVRVYGAWLTPSVSTRLASDADALERALSWELLRGPDGALADLSLTDGIGYPMPVYVAEVNSVRAYVTDVNDAAAASLTTATATTVPTLTVQDPTVIVTYGKLGS